METVIVAKLAGLGHIHLKWRDIKESKAVSETLQLIVAIDGGAKSPERCFVGIATGYVWGCVQ